MTVRPAARNYDSGSGVSVQRIGPDPARIIGTGTAVLGGVVFLDEFGTRPAIAAAGGVSMLIIGRGINHRHRLAAYVLGLLLAAVGAACLRSWSHPVMAAAILGLALYLLISRHAFTVAVGRTRFLAIAVAAVVVGLSVLAMDSITALMAWPEWPLTAVGALSAGTVFVVAFAPRRPTSWPTAHDRALARFLCVHADPDTVAPFVLRRDKQLVFAPSGRAVLGYRYIHGVGLAAGDPVGAPTEFVQTVEAFGSHCDVNGWRSAIVGVRADRLTLYTSAGWRALYIGDEAVVDVRTEFSLVGRPMRNLRQALNRSRRAANSVELLLEADVGLELRKQLLDLMVRARRGHREFGFSMALGDVLTGEYPDCLIAVGRDSSGAVMAFQRYVPCSGGTALSLDAMYRDRIAPNGLTEHVVVEVIEWAQRNNVSSISLNFAAFRSYLDPKAEHTRPQKALAYLVHRIDGTLGIQLDTLRVFNEKFRPNWIPRYLVYRSALDLPAIALAALSAEGFLPMRSTPHR